MRYKFGEPLTKVENCKQHILGLLERFAQDDIGLLDPCRSPLSMKMIQKGLRNYFGRPFHHGTVCKAIHELLAEKEIRISNIKGPRGGKKYELYWPEYKPIGKVYPPNPFNPLILTET